MRPAASCEGGVLYGADDLVARFVWTRLGGDSLEGQRALGLVHDGVLVGGAVFKSWTHRGIDVVEFVIASDKRTWCRSSTLRRLFAFAFGDLGLPRLLARTPVDNAPVRDILERVGFRLEGEEDGLAIYWMRRR